MHPYLFIFDVAAHLKAVPRPSPPVITFSLISEFSYKLIGFLLNCSMVKSDNEIETFSY